jgi:hypothetical protein
VTLLVLRCTAAVHCQTHLIMSGLAIASRATERPLTSSEQPLGAYRASERPCSCFPHYSTNNVSSCSEAPKQREDAQRERSFAACAKLCGQWTSRFRCASEPVLVRGLLQRLCCGTSQRRPCWSLDGIQGHIWQPIQSADGLYNRRAASAWPSPEGQCS